MSAATPGHGAIRTRQSPRDYVPPITGVCGVGAIECQQGQDAGRSELEAGEAGRELRDRASLLQCLSQVVRCSLCCAARNCFEGGGGLHLLGRNRGHADSCRLATGAAVFAVGQLPDGQHSQQAGPILPSADSGMDDGRGSCQSATSPKTGGWRPELSIVVGDVAALLCHWTKVQLSRALDLLL